MWNRERPRVPPIPRARSTIAQLQMHADGFGVEFDPTRRWIGGRRPPSCAGGRPDRDRLAKEIISLSCLLVASCSTTRPHGGSTSATTTMVHRFLPSARIRNGQVPLFDHHNTARRPRPAERGAAPKMGPLEARLAESALPPRSKAVASPCHQA